MARSSLSRLQDNRLALLLDPAPASGQLADIAHRVLSAVTRQLALSQEDSTCHVGIAIGPRDGNSAQELTVAAGRAIERGRLRSPAGDVSFFANGQDARMLHQRQMEADLAEAIDRQQFTLVFQPIVHLDTAALAGFEALIRWTHPVRGPVPPSEFIPVAEANGMIVPISEWVIERALSQLAAFDRIGGVPMRMFINIAASQFDSPGFIDKLRTQLLRHGVPGRRVELEITERMVADHTQATLQTLQALRLLGISVAIDDFGTGYSNLRNLTQLSINTLKIDMSFTQSVTHSAAAASVSRMISELGRRLELNVVVEGIETEGQLNHSRTLGCAFGQGYLFSKPLQDEAACELLRSDTPLFVVRPPEDALHLLLLDDEENILSALRRLLRREGYRVHATTSPMQAYEILATHPIGVVVSDQRMPQMNSSYYGLSRRIGTVTDALAVLGFNMVRRIITSLVMMQPVLAHLPDTPATRAFWRHQLLCAVFARCLHLRSQTDSDEVAYLAGLLHEVGRLAMFVHWPEIYAEFVESPFSDERSLVAAEQQRFGFDHAQAGGALLHHWGVPEVIATAAGRHADEVAPPEPVAASVWHANRLAHLVALAAQASGESLWRKARSQPQDRGHPSRPGHAEVGHSRCGRPHALCSAGGLGGHRLNDATRCGGGAK